MTLRWVEGFEATGSQAAIEDYYENVTWTAGTSFVAGHVHGTALQSAASGVDTIFRTPDLEIADDDWIVGMRVCLDEVAINTSKTLIAFYTGTTLLGFLQWRTQNPNVGVRLRYLRANGAAVVEGVALANDVHRYVEVRVRMTNAITGQVEVIVDGAPYILITGVQTTNVAATTLNKVQFHLGHSGNAASKVIVDDIYVLDQAGGVKATFLGNQSVEAVYPNADGAVSDWTALGAGDHYLEVDELTVDDDDTSYVFASVDNDEELFEFTPLAQLSGTINGVMVKSRLKNDAAGSRNVQTLHRSVAGNVSNGATKVVNTTAYAAYNQIWEVNPDGSVAWTVAEIDGSQFGMELIP